VKIPVKVVRRKVVVSEKEISVSKRELWIDYARGLALILVVLAHSQIPGRLFEFISYVIVVFPLISGYLMKEMSIIELIKRRKTLILSYYYIGAIGYLVWVMCVPDIFRKADNLTYLKNYILVRTDLFDKIPLPIVPLWYLIFLFIAELMYQIFSKIKMLPYAIFAGILARYFHPTSLPFKLDVAFSGLYMFWLGRWIKKNTKILETFHYILGIFGFTMWLLSWYFFGGTSWNVDEYGRQPLMTLIGEIGTAISFYWLGKVMEKYTLNNSQSGKFFDKITSKYILGILKVFSDNSIFAFGYHILVGGIIVVITMALGFTVTEETLKSYWYITFTLSFGTMLTLLLVLPKPVKLLMTQPDEFLKITINGRSNRK